MNVNRSSFYKWRKRRMNPTEDKNKEKLILDFLKNIMINIQLMVIDGLKAKIELDLGVIYSDNYSQRVCSYAGIRSVSKRFKRYRTSDKWKIYPNLLFADLTITSPYQLLFLI